MVLDKLKALSDKTLFSMGLTLQVLAILFVIIIGFFHQIVLNWWMNVIFYSLYFLGLLILLLAFDQRRKNNKT